MFGKGFAERAWRLSVPSKNTVFDIVASELMALNAIAQLSKEGRPLEDSLWGTRNNRPMNNEGVIDINEERKSGFS